MRFAHNLLSGTVPSGVTSMFPAGSTTWSSNCVVNGSSTLGSCVERAALMDLYTSAGGASWSADKTGNWSTYVSPCDWSGVSCQDGSSTSGSVLYVHLSLPCRSCRCFEIASSVGRVSWALWSMSFVVLWPIRPRGLVLLLDSFSCARCCAYPLLTAAVCVPLLHLHLLLLHHHPPPPTTTSPSYATAILPLPMTVRSLEIADDLSGTLPASLSVLTDLKYVGRMIALSHTAASGSW